MSDLGFKVRILRQIGLLKLQPPIRLIKAGAVLRKWGPGFPSAVAAAAARFPDQAAVIDDTGSITWAELSAEVNQFTQVLKDRDVAPGDSVAVLCRNHHHMVVAMVAVIQAGGRILLLNTMASGSQMADLVKRETAKAIVLDQEFLATAHEAGIGSDEIILAWTDADKPAEPQSIADLIVGAPTTAHPKPSQPGSVVIFTSGTTGLPKGARRSEPEDLGPLMTFFGSIPYRGNSTVILSAPLFHSWGLINFGFGLSTVPTYVMHRRFDAGQVIRDIEEHRAEVLVVVPLMIQRLVDADPGVIASTDVSSLKITASSGSALAGDLAIRFQDLFTDSVYNFYGATETGWVTIASPEQLRSSPGTAGTPPHNTVVKILAPDGTEVPKGQTGVIHVGNEMPFGGYTDGNTKSFVDGLMSTGDIGYLDEDGCLFVSGRDDDMVISGGENVFPRELEDVLIGHPAVADVVVTGIDDADWGQCLAAHVVVAKESQLTEQEVIDYARKQVARFAVPRRIQFLDELPRNPTGKVMKRELPDFD